MFRKLVIAAILVAISATATAATKQSKQLTGVVNINTATAAELTLLPGIGKSKADAIIAFRQTNPFKSAADLVKVKGIGDKMLSKIQQYVVVDGPTTAKVVKVQTAPASAQTAGAGQQVSQKTGL
jgi:competence protein ComEA